MLEVPRPLTALSTGILAAQSRLPSWLSARPCRSWPARTPPPRPSPRASGWTWANHPPRSGDSPCRTRPQCCAPSIASAGTAIRVLEGRAVPALKLVDRCPSGLSTVVPVVPRDGLCVRVSHRSRRAARGRRSQPHTTGQFRPSVCVPCRRLGPGLSRCPRRVVVRVPGSAVSVNTFRPPAFESPELRAQFGRIHATMDRKEKSS